jgi:hypothetical protein
LDLELAKTATEAIRKGVVDEFFLNRGEVEKYMEWAEEDRDKPPTERRVLMLDNVDRSEKKVRFSFDEFGERDEILLMLGDQAENYAHFSREAGLNELILWLQQKEWVNKRKAAYVSQIGLESFGKWGELGIEGAYGAGTFIRSRKYALKKEGVHEVRGEVSMISMMREARLIGMMRRARLDGPDMGKGKELNGEVGGEEAVGVVKIEEKIGERRVGDEGEKKIDEKKVDVGEAELSSEEQGADEPASSSDGRSVEMFRPEDLKGLKLGDIPPEMLSRLLIDFVESEYRVGIKAIEDRRSAGLAELDGLEKGEDRAQRRVAVKRTYSEDLAGIRVRREGALRVALEYVERVRGEEKRLVGDLFG